MAQPAFHRDIGRRSVWVMHTPEGFVATVTAWDGGHELYRTHPHSGNVPALKDAEKWCAKNPADAPADASPRETEATLPLLSEAPPPKAPEHGG